MRMPLYVFLLVLIFSVRSRICELGDKDFADLLLREGTKIIEENQDLYIWSHRPSRRIRRKRAYWGFDKLFSDAIEAKNDVSRFGQMIGGYIKDNFQVL